MPSTAVFSQWLAKYLLDLSAGVLSAPQLRHLRHSLLALIMLATRRTLTNQVQLFGYQRDESCLKRFLTHAPWSHEALQRRQQERLLALLEMQPVGEPIELLVDDTATVKHGRRMEGLSRHYCDGKVRWGHCKVTLFLCCGDLKVPWDYRLYMTKATCAFEEQVFASKLALAKEMLDTFTPPAGRAVRVLFDSFYMSKDMVKYVCVTRQWDLLARIEANRHVTYRGRTQSVRALAKSRRKSAWEPLTLPTHDYLGCQLKVKLWHGVPGTLTMTCDPDQPDQVHYLIANRRDLSAGTVLRLYQHRWYIETYHRDVKQLLGLAHYQLRSRLGLQRYWLLVDLAYSVLRLQTCAAAKTQLPNSEAITLGQLRKQVQKQAERDKLAQLLAVYEQTGDRRAVYQAAGCA
jgi:SRSO17 transposase